MFRALVFRLQHWQRPEIIWIELLACTAFLLILLRFPSPPIASAQDTIAAPPPQEHLPEPKAHPLPASLAQWQDVQQRGDYFAAIEPTPIGYLVWSAFPIQVFVEPVPANAHISEADRSQTWIEAVNQAIQEWNIYLPLQWVDTSDAADIAIWRSAPPLQLAQRSSPEDANTPDSNASSGHTLPRIRSAETQYHLFVDRPVNAAVTLSQRFTIQLTPNQTPDYIKATARHEIGHALGIWGHSPIETDALYFSQVRHSPPISDRDINTLKRIYQQPTRVGWQLVID